GGGDQPLDGARVVRRPGRLARPLVEVAVTTGLDADIVVSRSEAFSLLLQLHIPAGRTAALLGPNGAGKSTAVAAVAGLLPIERGTITLDGRVLDDPDRGVFVPADERNIGVVFQDHLLFPHMSVIDNVARSEERRVGEECTSVG